MPNFVYSFGPGRSRSIEATRISLAVALAVMRYGSDREVCRVLKISRNVLARWRSGTVPRAANRRALAIAAEIPIEWLADLADELPH